MLGLKCIKAGCDNKQASGSSYCYLHKPYTGSGKSHSSSSYSNKSSGSTSKSSTGSLYSQMEANDWDRIRIQLQEDLHNYYSEMGGI